MEDLENNFFLEDQDIADVFSGDCSEYGSMSLNCSLSGALRNMNSDKQKDNSMSSSKCDKVKTDFIEVAQEKNFLDHRFSVRFTPKAIKRKFAGPAGLISDEDWNDLSMCDATSVSKKLLTDETDYQHISSSQSSIEELFCSSSWKKLQDDVSSNLSFLSLVKHFSIQRVLNDTSKKKLPKHIIVPALCVYIKEFNDPVCVCMDDTGEINGKIDKEVLQLYSDFIKCGTSLILKQVTFLCNVLLLQKANVLSFYLDDGSIQHIQDWNAVREKESDDNINGINPKTPKLTEIYHTKTVKNTSLEKPRLDMNNKLSLESGHSALKAVSEGFYKKNKQNLVVNSPTLKINQDFETDIMDEFDEFLGNLDEKSLLEEF